MNCIYVCYLLINVFNRIKYGIYCIYKKKKKQYIFLLFLFYTFFFFLLIQRGWISVQASFFLEPSIIRMDRWLGVDVLRRKRPAQLKASSLIGSLWVAGNKMHWASISTPPKNSTLGPAYPNKSPVPIDQAQIKRY